MQAKLFLLLVLARTAHADEPTGTFGVGAGYNTDDGFIASASVTQTDLFHTGKLLSLDARLDEREQRFVARYSDPAFLGTSLQLDARLTADLAHHDGYWHDTAGASLGLSKIIAPHVKIYGQWRIEHDHDHPDDGVIDPNVASREYSISALRGGVEYNSLDRAVDPTNGSRIGSYIELGSPAFGYADTNEQLVHTRTYGETHHALAGSLRVNAYGSFETLDAAGNGYLYPGQLLQFDGSSQLRGYAPDRFGPRDAWGTHTGANLAAFGRVELEAPLFGHSGLSGVAFVDGGLMANNQRQGEMAATTGFGLIWHSPIGPIGGYWAWDKLSGKPSFVFGVGSLFGQ